jgi:hypothetical protein
LIFWPSFGDRRPCAIDKPRSAGRRLTQPLGN